MRHHFKNRNTVKLNDFFSDIMEELTEVERIVKYLDEITSMRRFQAEILMDLSVYDLYGNASLDGIRKDTIAEVLDKYKIEYKEKDSQDS